MSKKELISFCLKGVFAGVAIGLGAVGSLLAKSMSGEIEGSFFGAFLFTLGLLVVLMYDMRLFTGMVARISSMGYKEWWRLAVCFVCNAIGIGLVALIVRYTFLGDKVVSQASSIVATKIVADYWPIKSFCSAIMCGFLITFSVLAKDKAKGSGLSATLGVILPVFVFAFCGFDHSVANMLYIYYYGAEGFLKMPLEIIGYILLVIAGNIVGGVAYPLGEWLMGKSSAKKE